MSEAKWATSAIEEKKSHISIDTILIKQLPSSLSFIFYPVFQEEEEDETFEIVEDALNSQSLVGTQTYLRYVTRYVVRPF